MAGGLDGGNPGPGLGQRRRHREQERAGAGHHHPPADGEVLGLEQRLGGAGGHYTGKFPSREREGELGGPGGEDERPGPDRRVGAAVELQRETRRRP